jgi:hypothetical protein
MLITTRYAIASALAAFSAYCVFADHGAGGGHHAPVHHEPAHVPHHEPAVSYSEPQYYSPPAYGAPSYGGYQQEDPLLPTLYPAAVIGGLGCLGFAYFVNRIDDGYNKSLHAFEALHHNVDHRLQHLEDAIYNRGKEQKKLDFKTKMLCKFANLFNNPTYEICNQGFDAGAVVGPTGAYSGQNTAAGVSHLAEEGSRKGNKRKAMKS